MTPSAFLRRKWVIGLMAVAATVFASAAGSAEKSFTMTITGGALPADQRVMKVAKDDTIRFRVTADVPGDLHLHGYRLEMKLVPGKPSEITFKAYATGRYPLEWHVSGDKTKAAKHHGPDFAVLEVYPR